MTNSFKKKIFNIIILASFAIATFMKINLCCVAIATDTKKLNCVICEIVFFRNRNSQFRNDRNFRNPFYPGEGDIFGADDSGDKCEYLRQDYVKFNEVLGLIDGKDRI